MQMFCNVLMMCGDSLGERAVFGQVVGCIWDGRAVISVIVAENILKWIGN